jgi:hypothetical protein
MEPDHVLCSMGLQQTFHSVPQRRTRNCSVARPETDLGFVAYSAEKDAEPKGPCLEKDIKNRKNLVEFEDEFETALGYGSGNMCISFMKKNWRSKIS